MKLSQRHEFYKKKYFFLTADITETDSIQIPIQFTVNKTFLYCIVEGRYQISLFQGRITKPCD